ncbi:MAG: LytTR family DNA-binding domain-containing protein [Bacteroidia bacterium]|nr:LytTR family DNA-binding domain-containing protein [Bacteroidia bacterium]
MSKFKVLIVDDESLARKLLNEHASKMPQLEVVAQCKTALEAQAVLLNHHIDILLLDIQMPDLTGLEFLRTLRNQPATILTTAYVEYAVDAYDLEVVDYLLKPIVFERFFRAVSRAMGRNSRQIDAQATVNLPSVEPKNSRESLFVKTDQRLVQVNYSDIRYIEGLREYVRIHTTQDQLIVLQSLSRLLDALPKEKFARIHRSYIINLEYIDSIVGNMVYLDDTELPISKGQREAFLNLINRDRLF